MHVLYLRRVKIHLCSDSEVEGEQNFLEKDFIRVFALIQMLRGSKSVMSHACANVL